MVVLPLFAMAFRKPTIRNPERCLRESDDQQTYQFGTKMNKEFWCSQTEDNARNMAMGQNVVAQWPAALAF